MMSSFQVKLATAMVVVSLIVETSALLNDGGVGWKNLPHVFGCESSSRKTFPGKEGSIGCENLVTSGNKNLPTLVLRSIPWHPPAPIKYQPISQGSTAPPPQMI